VPLEKIPGLGALIEKIMDSISVFIFTMLEPYVIHLLKTATTGLNAASGEAMRWSAGRGTGEAGAYMQQIIIFTIICILYFTLIQYFFWI
jgi:hypothetical protein